jgi:nucleoside-diphosphate-sugar epimerase
VLDLTSPLAADELASRLGPATTLIVTARARVSSDPFRTFTDDIAIAANVARCLIANPPRRCVYFSSTSVYGDVASNLAITEETPLAPNSLYGTSKVAAEGTLRHAADRADVPLFILRPCMVYGPDDPSSSYGPGRFVRSVLQDGKVRVFGDGNELRDYLFVRDLVNITLALAFDGSPGIYNLASGTSHSFQQILTCLRDIISDPFSVVTVPRDRPATDQRFDTSRLRGALPNIRLIPLEEGLAETVAACAVPAGRS